MLRSPLLVLAVAGTLAGCKLGSSARSAADAMRTSLQPPAPPTDTIPEMLEYAADLGVNITEMGKLPEGVLWADLSPGEGQPVAPGDSVELAIAGWLPDGSLVDSSVVTLRLGNGQLVDGLELGVRGMMPGGRRQLVLPPGLGYGEQGGDNVPPNSVLVYLLELRAAYR